jgi:hypothetical protein
MSTAASKDMAPLARNTPCLLKGNCLKGQRSSRDAQMVLISSAHAQDDERYSAYAAALILSYSGCPLPNTRPTDPTQHPTTPTMHNSCEGSGHEAAQGRVLLQHSSVGARTRDHSQVLQGRTRPPTCTTAAAGRAADVRESEAGPPLISGLLLSPRPSPSSNASNECVTSCARS